MSELTIKFSEDYCKLPEDSDGKLAILKCATSILLQHQTKWFLLYDTQFRGSSAHYPLPKQGEYILLLFELSGGGIFTTLRRWTPEKKKYYYSNIGKFFKVKIEKVLKS